MTQHQTTLPISCVEGWSINADWEGIKMADLLDAAGARHGATVRVVSLEKKGAYKTSTLNHDQARASNTLLAMRVNGAELDIQHGFPLRLIAPNRPGVLQTKWVGQLVIS
jgi:DMSO/TMAO reductase YedYZ molybdopterin-dependent catalytic subunit